MKKVTIVVFLLSIVFLSNAQSLVTRSSEFQIDLNSSTPVTGDIPVITWMKPIPDVTFLEDGKYSIKFTVESSNLIKSVLISVKEKDLVTSRGSLTLTPGEGESQLFNVEKNLMLQEGENVIIITAENAAGIKTTSYKRIGVGADAIANATRLDRTDYAVLFATDNYEYWSDLVNPVYDTRTIAELLKSLYNFKVEIVENATQNDILKKLREYAEKRYKPQDQVFIFFAGHGHYDQTFAEGFVVTTESLVNDEGKTSFLSHNRLRSIVNNIPCEHIFLTMDVCFGGTFDEALASARGDESVYSQQSKSEFITRKLISKTRKYLTSGGKTYVSDGIAGQHSPFAKNFIEALKSQGGDDGILTISEIFAAVEKLKTPPRLGGFGDNAPNSDFLFITR
jgi:hypothetical protein